ncbi:MAG: PIN domain-containing protein [Candidatus Diapherotrites archaeon]
MRVTVDANILFSALIKKGQTRKVWFNPEIELCAPEFLLKEFLKYREYLQKKASGTPKEFQDISETLFSQVFFIPDSELKPFLPAAAFLSNDAKDWLYLACALKEDTIIWSNDKEFKKQKRIKIKSTKEMIEETGML